MKKKNLFFKGLFLFAIIFLIYSSDLVLALTPTECAVGTVCKRIDKNGGSETGLYYGSTCYDIVNNDANYDYFVPLNGEDFNSFLTNKPASVSITVCSSSGGEGTPEKTLAYVVVNDDASEGSEFTFYYTDGTSSTSGYVWTSSTNAQGYPQRTSGITESVPGAVGMSLSPAIGQGTLSMQSGSVIPVYLTGSRQNGDGDEDGICEAGETCCTTSNELCANSDTDGDGISNEDEWAAGTNPTDAGSAPIDDGDGLCENGETCCAVDPEACNWDNGVDGDGEPGTVTPGAIVDDGDGLCENGETCCAVDPEACNFDNGETGGDTGGDTKIICAEIHRQGLMSDEIYLADEEFGKEVAKRYPEVAKGYNLFAQPIVDKMQKSEEFTQVVNVIVKPWSEEMAYRMDARENGNFVGAVIMSVGMFVLGIFGSFALGQINFMIIGEMTILIVTIFAMTFLRKKLKLSFHK